MTVRWQLWGLRLFLGLLFLFGSEIILWTNDLNRSPLDWGGRLVAYTLLAGVVLDLAVRYRIRDEYDTMALLAIYALCSGLLITPYLSFADFPRTLLTRVLGGHGLVGIEMFALLLTLTNRHNQRMLRLLIPVSLWNGFFWGVWLRWMPIYGDLFPAIRLDVALMVAGGVGLVIFVGRGLLQRIWASLQPTHLLFSTLEWLFIGLAGMIIFVIQAIQNTLSIWGLIATVLLVGVSWAVLWYRRDAKGAMLLEAHFPPQPRSAVWLIVAFVAFALASLFAYVLPLAGNDQINQLWLMEIGFGIVGTLWYPLIAVIIAFRGVDAQMRAQEL